MKEQDGGQDDQCRHERKPRPPFHVAREIEEVANRAGEQDDQGNGETTEQKPVLPTDEIHEIGGTVVQPWTRGRMFCTFNMPKPPKKRETRPQPPAVSGRLFTPMRVVALVVIVMAGVGLFAYMRGAGPGGTDQAGQASDARPAQSAAATPVASADESTGPPANARFGPHKQNVLPPLPFGPSPPARPPDVVRAVYSANGDVRSWEPHGMT